MVADTELQLKGIKEKLQNAQTEYVNIKKKFVEDTKVLFNDSLKELFLLYPQLESFGWSQYTPYFMDGEECVFSANIDASSININKLNGHDIAYEEDDVRLTKLQPYQAIISSLLYSIPEETLKDMYGDHIEVTIYRNGNVEVQECSHD